MNEGSLGQCKRPKTQYKSLVYTLYIMADGFQDIYTRTTIVLSSTIKMNRI